jgi:hypothetical protein
MRGHSIAKSAKIEFKAIWIQPLLLYPLHQQAVVVHPLRPAGQLHPRVHEIESPADLRLILIRQSIVGLD